MLLEMFGTKREDAMEIIELAMPKFEVEKISTDMVCQSTKQAKYFESVMEYVESVADCRGRIKDDKLVSGLALKNWTVKYSDDEKYIHITDIVTGYKYGTFSMGNKKLCKNDKIQFILFNLLQIVTCPNATEGCLKFCYADKSNNGLKVKNSNSRISRTKNTVLSMFANFEDIVNEVIKLVKSSTSKTVVFRWHESGDIYSKNYFNKVKRIMKTNTSVKFMFYTKTIFTMDEINQINKLPNVALRYSLDDTSSMKVVNKVHENNILNTVVICGENICKAVESIDNAMVCNFNLTQEERDAVVNEIREIEKKMDNEHRKTYKAKMQTEINKLTKSLLNPNQKCHSCMKCYDKNRITIMFGAH